MLILGIDPGTATTGYGLVNYQKTKLEAVGWGLIETDKENLTPYRFINIYKQMNVVIKKYQPEVMAIERLFFATNAKTAIRVGQAQGVMLYCAARSKIEIFEYAPARIKKIITGNGRADKKDVQRALRDTFGAKVRSKKKAKTHFDNAADALAVALCHAIHIRDGV